METKIYHSTREIIYIIKPALDLSNQQQSPVRQEVKHRHLRLTHILNDMRLKRIKDHSSYDSSVINSPHLQHSIGF